MPDPDRTVPLGEVIDRCYDEALDAWSRQHAGGVPPEAYRVEEIEGVTLTFSRFRRRPSYLYIEITARRPWQSATYGYRILTMGSGRAAPTPQRVV